MRPPTAVEARIRTWIHPGAGIPRTYPVNDSVGAHPMSLRSNATGGKQSRTK